MEKNAKIYIAGHRGLLGAALMRALCEDGYTNLILRTRLELDLKKQSAVMDFFSVEKPDYVFLTAARVGNIAENIKYPADFLRDNLLIQENVMEAALRFNSKSLMFFSSNCCYPRECAQPMKEEHLMTGPLEPTNEAYALAKIVGMKLCQSYNAQHGTLFGCLVPASLYGPNDHFGTSQAHVIAGMIDKLHKAKETGPEEVVFWSDGSSLREFLFVDDAADAAIFFMRNNFLAASDKTGAFINIGTGEEISIFNLAALIARIVGYAGKIGWDASKPGGMPRKLLDSSRCHALGWRHKTGLEDGIRKTYEWYLKNGRRD